MKKIFTLLFVLCSIAAVYAQEFKVGPITYSVTGEGTVCVYEADSRTEYAEVVVPETVENAGKTYTVTSVDQYAFRYLNAKKLVLANTITLIKKSGVYNTKLEEIVLPTQLKTIETFALAYNRNLKSITIPEGVTEIPSSCFSSDNALETIVMPETITSIGGGAFYKVGLKEFTVPAKCTELGSNLFQLAPNLTKVVLHKDIEVLGEGTFRECINLESINLEVLSKVTEFPTNLLLDCAKVTSATIPANVKKFGAGAFGGTSITEFKLAEGNTNFVVENKSVYTADKRVLVLFPPKGTTECTVAEGCVGIGAGAFSQSDVTKVTLPESLLAIDAFAFVQSKLAEINLPNGIVLIGDQAFAGTQLTNLVLPESLTFVSDGLVAWSPKLESVTLGSQVRDIANHAFAGCKALKEFKSYAAQAPLFAPIYGEDDSPFGYVDLSAATLYIPAGSDNSYKQNEWFSYFQKHQSTLPAGFVPVMTTPGDYSQVEVLGKVTLTFPADATVAVANPEVVVRSANEFVGENVHNGTWKATLQEGKKTIVELTPLDAAGKETDLKIEKESYYFIHIPAGIVKNAEGVLNQKIVLTVQATATSSVEDVNVSACTAFVNGNNVEVVLGDMTNCTVEMYDLTGKLVNRAANASGSVSFEVEAAGIYLVRVNDGQTQQTFKLLKK